jgi:MATE family multidrug resistance protein
MTLSRPKISVLKKELRALTVLAIPVAIAELGWMLMTVVDTAMVGHLSALAIAATGLGGVLYTTIVLFGFGLLLSMDPLVAQAYGRGDMRDCHHTLHQGVFLSLALTLPLMALTYLLPSVLLHWNVNPTVTQAAAPFIRILALGTLPLLLYACLRRYLQALHLVRSIMVALLTANLLNAVGDWALIYGHLGLPALGIVGAAWATNLSRVYLMLYLAVVILLQEQKHHTGLLRQLPRLDFVRLRQMLHLGLPASGQILLEMGAFAAATVLIGRLSAVALAAHQIVLNCATLTYSVPLGIGSATAVGVGHAIGRKDFASAVRTGWLGIALGAACMSLSAALLFLFPRPILHIYTNDARVIAVGSGLLLIAAFFQLFDGIQTVTTGALRGAGDTHSSMLLNLLCYWVIGVPLGAALGLGWGHGVYGFWIGLSLAIILLAGTLLLAWHRVARKIKSLPAADPLLAEVPMDW